MLQLKLWRLGVENGDWSVSRPGFFCRGFFVTGQRHVSPHGYLVRHIRVVGPVAVWNVPVYRLTGGWRPPPPLSSGHWVIEGTTFARIAHCYVGDVTLVTLEASAVACGSTS